MKKIYKNSKVLGFITLEILEENEHSFKVRTEKGEIKDLPISTIKHYSNSKDLANCKYYIEEKTSKLEKINQYMKEIQRYTDELKELNEKFGYLFSKYPEEFI